MSKSIHLHPNVIGFFLDGWSDLVESMGTLADQVRQALIQDLKSRQMPDIKISSQSGYDKVLGDGKRPYVILQMHPGVTTTMYVDAHGTDLYVSWRTYIKPVINRLTLIGLIIFGVIMAFQFDVVGFFLGLVGGAVLLWIAGATLHQNPLKYFLVDVTIFDAEDITALSLSAHYSLLRALDQMGIDTSKLRIKEKFSSGRKGEDI